MVKESAQGLMTTTHVHKQTGHHHHLENEIQPRFSYQQADVKGYRAGIECQDVGVLHQRQAQGTELIAQLLRNVVTQRMMDFTRKKLSYDLPDSSYSPGLVSSPLHFWMPAFITDRLSKGFQQFGKSSHGFLTNEAVMIGVETRTSAPVRILRDNETLQHVTVNGLFPCGEGAGYAGGIVSAGIDGEKCAEAAATYLGVRTD